MRVIFLSHLYPKSKKDYYMKRSRCGLSAAADAHQYAIALGLNACCGDFELVNLPAVSHFPVRYKDPWLKSSYIEENGLRIHNVGYCTLPEYQFVSRCINARKKLEQIVSQSSEFFYIVVYGINFGINKAAIDIKNRYPGRIKLCNIIPDLPQDVGNKNKSISKTQSFLRGLYFKRTEDYFPSFDSFVLLTQYMREVVPCNDSQFIVSEGIYEETVTHRPIHVSDSEDFVLFYGGMLHERFGVKQLVDVFHSISNPKMKLQLCGYGDCVEYVKSLSESDKRIEYLGVIERERVLALEASASLLINPRIPDDNPFTRYSFPSKTMEYFASATPSLIYQLDGIPEEYYRYCYSLDANHTDSDSLRDKIQEIYSTPISERIKKGQEARHFIIENKNQVIEGKRIFELLKRTL